MQEVNLPQIQKISSGKNSTTYVLEPLFPGYGVTVGNSLRRVLLSSLPGCAPHKVKIEKAAHEFTTIRGVKEDVVEIILNLKSLRFKLFEGEEASAKLDVTGPKKVTGQDFKLPSNLELINPEQPIATLSRGGKLKLILTVNRGIGYVPVERKEEERREIGVILLDSLYTPVIKVRYNIENTRVGKMTNYDRLTLEITTDGTMTPDEALEASGKILEKHFGLISETRAEIEKAAKEAKASQVSAKTADIRKMKILETELPNRAKSALDEAGIKTVGGLLKLSQEKLAKIKGMGTKTQKEIEVQIKKWGFKK